MPYPVSQRAVQPPSARPVSAIGPPAESTRGEKETADGQPPAARGVSVARALRSTTFWLIITVYLLQLFVMSGIQMNAQLFAEKEAAYSMQMAPLFMAFAVGVTIPMRLLYGFLCDRFDPKYLMASAGIFLAGGAMVLYVLVIRLAIREGYLAILAFSLVQGIGIAGNAVVLPILVGRCFGERSFSKIIGLIMMGFAVGVIFGPATMAYFYDKHGTFTGAFYVAAALAAVSVVLALFIRTGALHKEFAPESEEAEHTESAA